MGVSSQITELANKRARRDDREPSRLDKSPTALSDELDRLSEGDEDEKVDLEYHGRLLEASRHYKHDDDYKELLALHFKLIAKGVLKQNCSLDSLCLPQSVLGRVRDLFECLDWALSTEQKK
uniref:Uncharacterized protein n=1 Tax=Globodera rostochiensis TaxID=31243 RepID=A0A914HQ64_GLORO